MSNIISIFTYSRIFKDSRNHVCIQYKKWSTDPEWKPKPDEPPLEVFKKDTIGRHRVPSGKPSIVEPSLEERQDISAIKKNIDKMKDYMTEEDYQWWQGFLEKPCDAFDNPTKEWYLERLIPWKREEVDASTELPDVELVSPLGLARARETEVPQVCHSISQML